MREARAPRSSGRVSGSLPEASASDTQDYTPGHPPQRVSPLTSPRDAGSDQPLIAIRALDWMTSAFTTNAHVAHKHPLDQNERLQPE